MLTISEPERQPLPPRRVPRYSAYEHKHADEWMPLARTVGWPEAELPKLSYVIWRESRGDPAAHNTEDPTRFGSRGLTQLNGFWCRRLDLECDRLWEPAYNLSAALAVWHLSGWSPWAL